MKETIVPIITGKLGTIRKNLAETAKTKKSRRPGNQKNGK